MTNEIKTIIRYLTAYIARLQAAIKALQEIEVENAADLGPPPAGWREAQDVAGKVWESIPPLGGTVSPFGGHRATPIQQRRARATTARVENGKTKGVRQPLTAGGKGARTREILEVIAGLAEPFTSGALAKVLPGESNGAYAALWRLQAKGWLRKSGDGIYTRTAKFQRPAPAPARAAPAPAGDIARAPAPSEKSEELAITLRARDRARESGNDKLAEIHQRKVDQLTAELEASK